MKKILFFGVICSFFFSCKESNLDKIESFSKLNLKKNVQFKEEINEWNDYNGDGFEILIFDLKQEYRENLINQIKKRYVYYDSDEHKLPFLETEIGKLLINSKGYYFMETLEGEEKIIVLDTIYNKLYYSYSRW